MRNTRRKDGRATLYRMQNGAAVDETFDADILREAQEAERIEAEAREAERVEAEARQREQELLAAAAEAKARFRREHPVKAYLSTWRMRYSLVREALVKEIEG